MKLTDKLGDWKIEGKADKLAIAGKKLYCLWLDKEYWIIQKDGTVIKHKLASKGVKLEPDEIETVANGETIIYNPEVPTFSLSMGQKFISREVRKTA